MSIHPSYKTYIYNKHRKPPQLQYIKHFWS